MFIRALYKDSRHTYGWHTCEFCGCGYITRVRPRKADNCGCRSNNYKHGNEIGKKPTPELKCYRKMRERCYSVACKDYKNYGGRGIRVCDRWLNSFDSFLTDMGLRPSSGHTLERLDVHGDYGPDNCVWATRIEQSKNKRNNVYVEFNGEVKILHDWLKELKIAKTTYYRLLKKVNNDYKKALEWLA